MAAYGIPSFDWGGSSVDDDVSSRCSGIASGARYRKVIFPRGQVADRILSQGRFVRKERTGPEESCEFGYSVVFTSRVLSYAIDASSKTFEAASSNKMMD